jgi:antitoxin component YwqK of YwqJK toxin-antitoxin module
LLAMSQEPLNQTDHQGRKQGFWQKQYPNGRILYQGSFIDDKPVGEWKRYHDSGDIKAILQYNETNDSVKARLFEGSADPVAVGTYVREKKEGLWTYYKESVKIAEEHFVKGVKEGMCRKFYPSGELLEVSEWKNNGKEGKYEAFFQSGKPYLQCLFRNNQRNGRCFSYFPSGLPEVESAYINDLPDGTWTYLDENGGVRYTLIYEKGTLKNPEVLISLDSQELEKLEKQRDRLTDPEKYLQNPEEYMIRKK